MTATISFGATFDVTAITPRPPAATTGRVIRSSPEKTAKSGAPAMTSWICAIDPLASFTPTMFRTRERRTSVSGSRFDAVRPGMLYTRSGSFVAAATASKCCTIPACVGLL